jgi:hypothetical protein
MHIGKAAVPNVNGLIANAFSSGFVTRFADWNDMILGKVLPQIFLG